MAFPGSEKVRNDLWEKISAIKSTGDYACGQRQLAEAEVQLIWAGHEKIESGWSHAESYARIAEDSIKEAQTAVGICNGKATATSKPVPTPAPIAIPVIPAPVASAPNRSHVIEKTTLSADALFEFNDVALIPDSISKLNKLADNIEKLKNFEEVILVGHTDRLRTDGKQERNQTLSESRAQRIKQYLVSKGMPANKITVHGIGSKEPLVKCSEKESKAKQIICLQPNRRVEITIRGAQ